MKRLLLTLPVLLLTSTHLPAQDGQKKAPAASQDSRLGAPKTYNSYFPWTPPKTREEWDRRRQQVHEQVLVANGLLPMPTKTPLKPVIHGKIQRDGYTVEKVFFASYPGHYVTGNLYRPTASGGKLAEGKHAAVLSPHGHWGDRSSPSTNGRFYDAGEKAAEAQVKMGAEKTIEGARYPLQARCAHLARMGCVVFHYDMVGYGDSTQILHAGAKMNPSGGFADAEAELRLQSFMGLQTYNSIRALDFVLSLPEVDAKRIGVTGASGGGTQTFILCDVDPRPTVAVPAVMVSTAMQGGCICENCTYLRVGTGNIELAGIIAPRPLGLIGADDWTIEIETKGYPQLQELYRLLGIDDLVKAKAFKQFKHNYNQVSREFMYNFMNKHLKLGHKEPVVEQPFVPVPPKELSVFDDTHPRPKDAGNVQSLRDHLTKDADEQLQDLFPAKPKSLAEYQRVIGAGLRAMIADSLPESNEVVEVGQAVTKPKGGVTTREYVLSRKGHDEAIPAVGLQGKDFDGAVVVWIHPDGVSSLWDQGKLVSAAQQILDSKAAILAVDVFGAGALAKGRERPINKNYAGYTFGYNRPLAAERVHDILTAVAFARGYPKAKAVHLVGWEAAGPWVVLARGLCGDAVARTAADLNQFRFERILSMQDEMMLPGALKYGGLPSLAGLCAPNPLYVHNAQGAGMESWTATAYATAGHSARLLQQDDRANGDKVVGWLLSAK